MKSVIYIAGFACLLIACAENTAGKEEKPWWDMKLQERYEINLLTAATYDVKNYDAFGYKTRTVSDSLITVGDSYPDEEDRLRHYAILSVAINKVRRLIHKELFNQASRASNLESILRRTDHLMGMRKLGEMNADAGYHFKKVHHYSVVEKNERLLRFHTLKLRDYLLDLIAYPSRY